MGWFKPQESSGESSRTEGECVQAAGVLHHASLSLVPAADPPLFEDNLGGSISFCDAIGLSASTVVAILAARCLHICLVVATLGWLCSKLGSKEIGTHAHTQG